MILYNYKATVVRVIDGDTVKLRLDLGFRLFWIVNCRLTGIDAPELDTDQGQDAKEYLIDLLPVDTELLINSKRLDKYGRPIVEIVYNGININTKMLNDGMAVKY